MQTAIDRSFNLNLMKIEIIEVQLGMVRVTYGQFEPKILNCFQIAKRIALRMQCGLLLFVANHEHHENRKSSLGS